MIESETKIAPPRAISGTLILVMGALFAVSAGWFIVLYVRGVERDSLDMEFAKALLQVGVVSVAATLLSLLVFNHQRRAEEDRRARERREEGRLRTAEARKSDLRYRQDLLKSTQSRITSSYNSTKRARRKVRALGLAYVTDAIVVSLASYDQCMSDVNDAQLELETIKSDVKTSAGAYPSAANLAPRLKGMEQYLGEVIEEYERVRSRTPKEVLSLPLIELPRFADFVGPSTGSNFDKRYSDAHSAARAAIRNDLQELTSTST